MHIAERMRKIRTSMNMSIADFASKIGEKDYKIRDSELGKQKISNDLLEKIGISYNINLNWLLTGKGEMLLHDKDKSLHISGNDNVTLNGQNNSIDSSFTSKKKSKSDVIEKEVSEIVSIPYFEDTYAAAGHGAINYEEAPRPMSFDKTFLQKQFGIMSCKNLHIINAIGNSMEPTLKEGELLMVNPFENEGMNIKDGGIYVISCNNSVLVKRVNFNPINGKVILISDNKEYSDIHIEKSDFSTCTIVGRVVGHLDRI